ncbi:monocarboxylate transporter 12-like isoform X2 [Apostichopus japonicus]|uniref:monocarboxylate transporter 12-like isoform X2 n=1 Tax=Stichopus japonicus TaxID=307972 RepID=UPI003AB7C3A7
MAYGLSIAYLQVHYASNLDRDILTQKWLVFIARFVVMFFLTGSVKIGGILFNNIASGDMSGALTGFMLILPYAIGRLCGPITSVLLTFCSFRLIGTIGGVLVGLGYVLIGLVASSPILHIMFSIIAGLGFACLLLPASLCLKEHFKDNYPAIMPLSMMGSYVGITILPPIMDLCRIAYGDSGTYIIYGALCWNLIPCGLLLCSPVSSREDQELKMVDESHDDIDDELTEGYEEEGYEEVEQREEGENLSHHSGTTTNSFVQSAYLNLKEYVLLFTNVWFCIFFVLGNLRKIPADGWTLFLIPNVIEQGFFSVQAATVASIGGFTGILGRVIAFYSFKVRLSPIFLYSVYYFVNGITFILMQGVPWLAQEYVPQFFGSAINGCLLSIQSGMTPGILVFIIESRYYKTAYGLLDFGNGVLTLVAGVVPGIFLDINGSFTFAFYLFGIISLFDGFLAMTLWILVRRRRMEN